MTLLEICDFTERCRLNGRDGFRQELLPAFDAPYRLPDAVRFEQRDVVSAVWHAGVSA